MSPEYVLPMSSENSVTYVPGWFVFVTELAADLLGVPLHHVAQVEQITLKPPPRHDVQ